MNASYWIDKLQLRSHPEGGYFKETYRSVEAFSFEGFSGKRNACTAIYFLLQRDDKSHFHKIKSDELWFFHEGSGLDIYFMNNDQVEVIHLGKNPEAGEVLQAVIPAGYWFGAKLKDNSSYALVSCTVSPGFDFRDFELARRSDLLQQFPTHKELINDLSLE